MKSKLNFSEEQLVAMLKIQDQKAFAYLYDNYAPILNGIICRLTQDKLIAEDILQEVFFKIWKNVATYDSSKGRLYTWMLSITRNFTIDMLRSKQLRNNINICGDIDSAQYIPDSKSGYDRLDILDIRNKFIHLTNEQRLIMNLIYFQGYTQSEVAKEIGIPIGTVKTRVRAATLALRNAINSNHSHPIVSKKVSSPSVVGVFTEYYYLVN